ncbi:23S rRNA methyltransferase attenuation leader peptide [Streptococcus suis]|nr:23S rRNA methyltransferase attenuation leader peptide [Streptococcus suis]NRG61196.1 23S rRNA methyltransferase attenuation leader peptide [Streptococcus suis]NRG70916.1 23S rRNA methyltransferase attenuation leader peptide [Streptococcus suis]NRH07893.1 23S rRNA methyltransferase attenuation leader peptide [Streptococcus suis]
MYFLKQTKNSDYADK